MLDILNGLEERAWTGIGAILIAVGGAVGAIYAARKGTKKDPVELGMSKPEPDLTQYVLKEVREANHKITALDKRVDDGFDENRQRLEEIQRTNHVLLDRTKR